MKLIISLLLCWLTLNVNAREKTSQPIRWCTTLEEALQQAANKQQPIFFNCYASWAGASQLMDSLVLPEPQLADFINKHFVPLRVDMVHTPEGRELAKRYNIHFYAHFLILDATGAIQHRIVGGSQAPEFLDKLKQGLNPKTSLVGMTRRYEKGDRSPRFLLKYAATLHNADETDKYKEVSDYYIQHVDSSEMFKPESWDILCKQSKSWGSPEFDFIYRNRDKLTKRNGDKVSKFIVQRAFQAMASYLLLEKNYNGPIIAEVEKKLEALNSESSNCRQMLNLCRILHLREQKNYSDMMELWTQTVPGLPSANTRCYLDVTLGQLYDLEEADKEKVAAYLTSQMAGMPEGTRLSQYRDALNNVTSYQGILFEHSSLQQALEKARREKKNVFVDCYTSWCGPCKMMSRQVFPAKQAGDYFNPRFVNLKIDMEKNEGKQLAKQWEIKAFPTYVILNPEGKIIYTTRGYLSVEELIKQIQEGVKGCNQTTHTVNS